MKIKKEENMTDCLFCRLAAREIPTEIVFESDNIFAFKDIDPKAPYHVLIIPKKHIPTLNDIGEEEKKIMGELLLAAKQIAAHLGIDETGYRTIINCNADGGQEVFHLHLHLLGGRKMAWPPG
jgi:histidine triad (HIT) family protein